MYRRAIIYRHLRPDVRQLRMKVVAAALLVVMGSQAVGDQLVYRQKLMGLQKIEWSAYDSVYGPWQNSGDIYDCSAWSPLASSVTIGQPFVQSSVCDQDQERSVQLREIELSGEIRNVGEPGSETRTVDTTLERDATGTMETWAAIDPLVGDWTNIRGAYDCSSWNPTTDTVTIGQSFQQSADCSQDQSRTVQDRESETTTGSIRNAGDAYTEARTIDSTITRQAVGTKESWSAVSPGYGAWTNVGAAYDCSNWSPAPETVTIGQSFQQSGTCSQNQTRSVQDREKEATTGAIRDSGQPYSETRVSTTTQTRQATGTKESWASTSPIYGSWTNVGAAYNCANWTPATNTVTIGQGFQQTGTCSLNQTRTVQDQEKEATTGAIRNAGSVYSETRVTSTTQARQATGTKETWVATTPTYGAWTNSGAAYNCASWTPATSTVTIGQAFVQTGTCSLNQTRTVQNRETETTTGALRNAGAATTESRTTTTTQTRQATGTKETWVAATPTYTSWTNTNALYACSNWSPAGSTRTASGTFVQTATNCKTDQSRQRQNRETETTTGAFRNVGSPVAETQTLTSQSATRNYTVTIGSWVNSGAVYGCTNWSPDPSTVNIGQTFTQTATNCSQNQTRSRVESYVDHITRSTVQVSSTTQSQTLTGRTSTRTATGTKVAAVCSFSAYKTEWTYWIDAQATMVSWNGVAVGSATGAVTSLKGTDGRTYSRGSFVANDNDMYIGRGQVYQTCRH